MGVMVPVTVLVLVVSCVVVGVCVALIDQQRSALQAASTRLQRAAQRETGVHAAGGSRSDGVNR